MSGSLNPWIRDYAIRIAEEYGAILSKAPSYDKKKKVQLTEFVTYGSDDNDSLIWGKISDTSHFVHIRFSRDAVAAYTSATSKRLTSLKTAIISIKNFRLDALSIPIDGGGMTESYHLVIDCREFSVLGSVGEGVFGNPKLLESEHLFRQWLEGLNQGGSTANIFKDLKDSREQPSPKANPSEATTSQTTADVNRLVHSNKGHTQGKATWAQRREAAFRDIMLNPAQYSKRMPRLATVSTSAGVSNGTTGAATTTASSSLKRKRTSDINNFTHSQKAKLALGLSQSTSKKSPGVSRSNEDNSDSDDPRSSSPISDWEPTPQPRPPTPGQRRRQSVAPKSPIPPRKSQRSSPFPSFEVSPAKSAQDPGSSPVNPSLSKRRRKDSTSSNSSAESSTSSSSLPLPSPSHPEPTGALPSGQLRQPMYPSVRRVPRPIPIMPSKHPGAQFNILAPNSDTSGSQEQQLTQLLVSTQDRSTGHDSWMEPSSSLSLLHNESNSRSSPSSGKQERPRMHGRISLAPSPSTQASRDSPLPPVPELNVDKYRSGHEDDSHPFTSSQHRLRSPLFTQATLGRHGSRDDSPHLTQEDRKPELLPQEHGQDSGDESDNSLFTGTLQLDDDSDENDVSKKDEHPDAPIENANEGSGTLARTAAEPSEEFATRSSPVAGSQSQKQPFPHNHSAWVTPSFMWPKSTKAGSKHPSSQTGAVAASATKSANGKTSSPAIRSGTQSPSKESSTVKSPGDDAGSDDREEAEESDSDRDSSSEGRRRLGGRVKVDHYNTPLLAGSLLSWDQIQDILLLNGQAQLQMQMRNSQAQKS